jgi:phosphoribosylformylglycinamidine synthase subunit PurS
MFAEPRGMKFKARIEVRLRKDLTDPESETVRKSLIDLDFQISEVRISKYYEIVIEADTKKDAEESAKLMCTRLLANPVKDEYSVEVEDAVSSRS